MYMTALFDLNFSQRKVLSCLLSDPAFQISTLEFTLGVPLPQASPSSVPKGRKDKEKTFNFQTCRLTLLDQCLKKKSYIIAHCT